MSSARGERPVAPHLFGVGIRDPVHGSQLISREEDSQVNRGRLCFVAEREEFAVVRRRRRNDFGRQNSALYGCGLIFVGNQRLPLIRQRLAGFAEAFDACRKLILQPHGGFEGTVFNADSVLPGRQQLDLSSLIVGDEQIVTRRGEDVCHFKGASFILDTERAFLLGVGVVKDGRRCVRVCVAHGLSLFST